LSHSFKNSGRSAAFRRRLCRELVEILDEKGGGGAEPWIKAAFVDLRITGTNGVLRRPLEIFSESGVRGFGSRAPILQRAGCCFGPPATIFSRLNRRRERADSRDRLGDRSTGPHARFFFMPEKSSIDLGLAVRLYLDGKRRLLVFGRSGGGCECSTEAIRQLEERALVKMRRALKRAKLEELRGA